MSIGDPSYMSNEDKALSCFYRYANGYCDHINGPFHCDPKQCPIVPKEEPHHDEA